MSTKNKERIKNKGLGISLIVMAIALVIFIVICFFAFRTIKNYLEDSQHYEVEEIQKKQQKTDEDENEGYIEDFGDGIQIEDSDDN